MKAMTEMAEGRTIRGHGDRERNKTKQIFASTTRLSYICNFARRDAMVQHYGIDLDIFRWRGMYMGVSLFVVFLLIMNSMSPDFFYNKDSVPSISVR